VEVCGRHSTVESEWDSRFACDGARVVAVAQAAKVFDCLGRDARIHLNDDAACHSPCHRHLHENPHLRTPPSPNQNTRATMSVLGRRNVHVVARPADTSSATAHSSAAWHDARVMVKLKREDRRSGQGVRGVWVRKETHSRRHRAANSILEVQQKRT
jgi:hypothetical protein